MYRILFRRIFSTYACTEKDDTCQRVSPRINGFTSSEVGKRLAQPWLAVCSIGSLGLSVQDPVPMQFLKKACTKKDCLGKLRVSP
jgi:hypothetical protein